MRRSTAGVLAFAVAPLISAVMLSATTPLVDRIDVVGKLGLVPVFYFYCAAVTLIAGLPIFLVLLRFGLARWWMALLVGLIIGAASAFVIESPHSPTASLVLFMGGTGTVSALGFWLLWRQGSQSAGIDQRKRPV